MATPGGRQDEVLTASMLEIYGADCPVPPAVWRKFEGPDDEVDLILDVRDRASPPTLVRMLMRRLRAPNRPAPDVMTVSSFVVISVTASELIVGVLPLTSWRELVAKAGALSAKEFEAELRDAAARRPFRTEGREKWEIQDFGRFRWLIVQLAETLRPTTSARVTGASLARVFKAAESGVAMDEPYPIRSVGVNRPVTPAVLMSRQTVKADAAQRVFEVDACDITWAVVDSGIDAENRAFTLTAAEPNTPRTTRILHTFDIPSAVRLLREDDPTRFVGLVDDKTWEAFAGIAVSRRKHAPPPIDPTIRHHGTHVAGILAGDERVDPSPDRTPPLIGVCPTVRLVDLRVFDNNGRCEELWVLVALRFIRWLNETGYLPLGKRIDGCNLSISTVYEVDAQACGWTPVCQEAERLVDSGVVVVAAAGNQAYDREIGTASVGTGFRFLSITDPGNTEAVITVGATDKTAPHRYGPIAGSGRGPTADGRHKPDLLAPGNLIAGPTFQAEPQEMTGTSQAAPHVSGVAAMLLARFPELRGQPDRVKRILCDSATDLGRLPDFQGAGLVDALRALQRP